MKQFISDKRKSEVLDEITSGMDINEPGDVSKVIVALTNQLLAEQEKAIADEAEKKGRIAWFSLDDFTKLLRGEE